MMLEAYDNATKEFIAIWIDNLGTGMSVSKGPIMMLQKP